MTAVNLKIFKGGGEGDRGVRLELFNTHIHNETELTVSYVFYFVF